MNRMMFTVAVFGGVMMTAVSVTAYELEHPALNQVKIGGEMGRRIDVTVKNNLMVIDVDKDFLRPFQVKKSADGFVGLGMLIDAITRLAFHTGDPDLIARKQHVVTEAIAAQLPDGYLGMMQPEHRIKDLWDVHEMSYLVLGLTSDYDLFKEAQSLDAAKKLANYLVDHLSKNPPPKCFSGDLSPEMPITGLADAMMYLSAQSGDDRYRTFCMDVLKIDAWRKPIVKGRWGDISGHVYAYLDKCLVQMRLDPANENAALHEMSKGALAFMLHQEGLTISGGCGDHECWHDTQSGTTNLGETCASAYLLKFFDEWMRQTPDPLYGDLMERVIYNTLFGAQTPDGRRIRYYTPFEAKREIFKDDTYCCPNNYRRGLAELPNLITYRSAKGLLVNLYTPSEIALLLADGRTAQVRQETDFPNSGGIKIYPGIDGGDAVEVALRIPRWCGEPSVRINGEATPDAPKPGTFFTVTRTWKKEDCIELTLPMSWQLVKGRQTQLGRVAIMRGPQIFALNPALNADLKNLEPRLLTLDVTSVQGPVPDDSVRPGGMACKISVWDPGTWYPGKISRELTLTEFADPGAEAIYFHVPNPEDPAYINDPLFDASLSEGK